MAGSSIAGRPCLCMVRASSTSSLNARWNLTIIAKPVVPRSLDRVVVVARQPSFIAPTRLPRGMRTLSKKTSQKSALPDIWRSGLAVTPGVFMSSSR